MSANAMEVSSNARVLLISSELDFSTDLVAGALKRRGCGYRRVNIEDFRSTRFSLDIESGTLMLADGDDRCVLSGADVRAVYFRGPTAIRAHRIEDIEPERLLHRSHGWGFLRALRGILGDVWMNDPVRVYEAEHKPLQLLAARRAGFDVPYTIIGTDQLHAVSRIPTDPIIVKPVDTALFSDGDLDAFAYAQMEPARGIVESDFRPIPVIFQPLLDPKVDIRVTVVGDTVFPVEVILAGGSIRGDWRRLKNEVSFRRIRLPVAVETACRSLTRSFGLEYGAIDLARVGDTWWFLEINPTGEWGWLTDAAAIPLADSIVDRLMVSKPTQ